MTRIARKPQNLAQNARLDPKSLHLDKPAAPAGTKTISERKQDHFFPGGAPGSSSPGDSTWIDGGNKPGKKPLLNGSHPIRGGSFGADRINRKHEDGGGMVGSKNDQASTTFRVDAENDPSTIVEVPSSGKNARQLEHENAVLRQQIEKLEAQKQKNKTPNPEGDEGGAYKPISQQEVKTQKKGLKPPKNDGDDGRGATQQTGSGGPMRETNGQDDRPAREKNTGTLNMDAVLKIDQLVNPQRH